MGPPITQVKKMQNIIIISIFSLLSKKKTHFWEGGVGVGLVLVPVELIKRKG